MHRGERVRRGFTITELIVVSLVLAVLASLAAPAMFKSRQRGLQLRCLATINGIGRMSLSYADDYRGAFPFMRRDESDGPHTIARTSVVPTSIPVYAYRSEVWRTYSSQSVTRGELLCPSHPVENIGHPWAVSDFLPTASMYIDPAYLRHGLPQDVWSTSTGVRANRIDEVHFPSLKVAAYEHRVWHSWKGPRAGDLGELFYMNTTRPGSTVFFDGHAEPLEATAAEWSDRQPVWGFHQFGMTVDGIRGRDR